jgi:multiple sugar transport system permease protein
MLGVSYVILFPFFSKVAGSFMSKSDVVDATVSLIPKNFTLDIYTYVITENMYFKAFFNTLAIALICALIQTFVACLVGYGLAKFKFKGNGLVMALVVITMIIPHTTLQLSMIRHFNAFELGHIMSFEKKGLFELILGKPLSLENTFAPLIVLSVCGLALKNGLYIYMMRQFFKGVPDELEESAYVDGSGTFRTFLQIILPLSIPMIITVFLFAFSWQWTDDFYTNFFFPTGETILMPDVVEIPDSLRLEGHAAWNFYSAAIKNTCGLMIIAPLVVLYCFGQKFLIQGIESSGLAN